MFLDVEDLIERSTNSSAIMYRGIQQNILFRYTVRMISEEIR